MSTSTHPLMTLRQSVFYSAFDFPSALLHSFLPSTLLIFFAFLPSSFLLSVYNLNVSVFLLFSSPLSSIIHIYSVTLIDSLFFLKHVTQNNVISVMSYHVTLQAAFTRSYNSTTHTSQVTALN